jgi:hypothetical protein
LRQFDTVLPGVVQDVAGEPDEEFGFRAMALEGTGPGRDADREADRMARFPKTGVIWRDSRHAGRRIGAEFDFRRQHHPFGHEWLISLYRFPQSVGPFSLPDVGSVGKRG